MKQRRSLEPEVRRLAILKSAKKLLQDRGYGEVQLDDVARNADVAKGTLYLYFKDKEHLVASVTEHVIDEMDATLIEALKDQTDPVERLKKIVEYSLDYFEKNKDFFIQCGGNRSGMQHKKISETVRRRFERHLFFLSHHIQACVHKGKLRKYDALSGGLFFVSLLRMFLMRKIYFGRKDPLRSASAEMMELLINGLGRHA